MANYYRYFGVFCVFIGLGSQDVAERQERMSVTRMANGLVLVERFSGRVEYA
jgi:hypothetical protein